MRNLISIAIVLGMSAAAYADAPKLDAVKAAAPKWMDSIAVPFAYQGLRYDDSADKGGKCSSTFGAHGVVKDAKKLAQFVACAKISDAADAFMGTASVAAFDPKKPGDELGGLIAANEMSPTKEVQKGYPRKLSSVAKKGGWFVAHGTKPDNVDGYWDESYDIFVAHDEGGTVKFDAIVVELSEQSPD